MVARQAITPGNKNRTIMCWLILLGLCFFCLWQTGRWTRKLELQSITQKVQDDLNVYVGDLQSELDKFETLPRILSTNPDFIRFLLNPAEKSLHDQVNRELERINELAQTSAIYIMDDSGFTLASSNWRGPVSFIGEKLSFRPYFTQAKEGRPGRYFALGTTSNVRGYYFSAPMYDAKMIIGVITVKLKFPQKFHAASRSKAATMELATGLRGGGQSIAKLSSSAAFATILLTSEKAK